MQVGKPEAGLSYIESQIGKPCFPRFHISRKPDFLFDENFVFVSGIEGEVYIPVFSGEVERKKGGYVCKPMFRFYIDVFFVLRSDDTRRVVKLPVAAAELEVQYGTYAPVAAGDFPCPVRIVFIEDIAAGYDKRA